MQAADVADGEGACPDGFDDLGGCDDFKTILAGVASAADVHRRCLEHERAQFVLLQVRRLGHERAADRTARHDLIDELDDARALDRNRAKFLRAVAKANFAADCAALVLVLKPVPVGIDARGVHDEKKFLGAKETGARAALPIWMDFMKAALRGKDPGEFQSSPELTPSAIAQTVDTPDAAPPEDETH